MNRRTLVPSFNEVIQDANAGGLSDLLATRQVVQSYLTGASKEDGMLVVSWV